VSKHGKEVKMKLWPGILLIIFLLAIMPLSACEYLGWGSPQQVSEEQIKAYQEYNQKLREYQEQQQEYQRKVIEEYNRQLTDTYQEYSDELNEYYEERQKAIEEAITQGE